MGFVIFLLFLSLSLFSFLLVMSGVGKAFESALQSGGAKDLHAHPDLN
jgi:hypothetical protein